MAFSASNLRRKNYGAPLADNAQPMSEFSYVHTDAAAVVEAAGYFNAAYRTLAKGDLIDAVMAMGGTPVTKRYVVTASSSAAVTIALQSPAAG